jgi:ferrous iron transport protein B
MSCSAKLPIYAVFAAAFFPRNAPLVMIIIYLFGIMIGIISALLMKSTIFYGNPVPFVMELPNYRMPSVKTVLRLAWDKAKDFLVRAFTVIFTATIIIWFLQTFDARFNVVTSSQDSMLAAIGTFIAPIFAPLGFGDWRASTALIAGFTAKEAVISTLAVLTGTNTGALGSALAKIFSPLTAFSFLIFTLLYTPCVAAINAVRSELNSVKSAVGVVLYQCGVAWIAAFIVYHIGLLFV